ncbi:hypothetical protein [Peribacillus asahii]|uniref:hypothetical protein n=1 Tax=Peribacillus asahii TaxID=228899 RepID=UPI00207A0FDB|nr:hypothetical protein [Peribacillus asahii]USK72639.1 hypothetical protein LIS76_23630 [Peribacillus asahii]USK72755.1 hypothetical protein LIS76_23810 [Peribacillus asahii]
MTLTYPVQLTNVSMPVDLKSYIADQKKLHEKTKNSFKRMLQESYIDYSKKIEVSNEIMQRQRYIIFCEQMKEDTDEIRYNTALEIREKREEIETAIAEMGLIAEPVTDLEIIRYLHTLFDYTGAQNRPIQNTFVPQIIEGGRD